MLPRFLGFSTLISLSIVGVAFTGCSGSSSLNAPSKITASNVGPPSLYQTAAAIRFPHDPGKTTASAHSRVHMALQPPVFGHIDDFKTPSAHAGANYLATGNDGAIWFTEYPRNQLAKMINNTVTEYAMPTGVTGSGPNDLAIDASGNIWITETYSDKISEVAVQNNALQYVNEISFSAGTRPWAIIQGPDGNMWFTEFSQRIGKISSGGAVTEYIVAGSSDQTGMIAAGPDGNLWVTMFNTDSILKVSTSGNVLGNYSLSRGAGPNGIWVGPSGDPNLYFTEYNGNRIGKISTSGTVTEFSPLPTSGSGPADLRPGPDGNLWVTEFNSNKLARISTSGALLNEWATCTEPWGLAIGLVADNGVYFSEDLYPCDEISRIQPL